MALSDNSKPEELLLFIRNFNMTLKASGTLKSGAEIQYLHTLVHGEALRQFDTLSAEVESDTQENLTSIILGLGAYFFPVNAPSMWKRAMRRRSRKPYGLKLRLYATRLIDLNEYLAVLPGEKASDIICVMELNFFNSMTNI